MKYLLTVEYDGTCYHGYQVQSGQITIQEKLQDAVEKLFGKRYPIVGCSRTDSGVHARDFKITFSTNDDSPKIPTEKIPIALNLYLPDDIAIKAAETVSDGFHVRYDVRSKEYEYLILNSRIRSPFLRSRAYFYSFPLDDKLMNEAAQYFLGTHDFSAFMSSGSDVEDMVRTIYSCAVERKGELITVRISGNGFLYNMVRIIVGTLIEVSCGKIEPEKIPKIIASKERSMAGFTAPACGLYLNRVEY